MGIFLSKFFTNSNASYMRAVSHTISISPPHIKPIVDKHIIFALQTLMRVVKDRIYNAKIYPTPIKATIFIIVNNLPRLF